MKFLITLLFLSSTVSVHSQEIDKLYYILGYMPDFSTPFYSENDLKSAKMTFEMHESNLSEIYRFSEVTGFKFKKARAEKDCANCEEFYNFINIPKFYKYRNFYDFTYITIKEFFHGLGEIEVKKQIGIFKPDVLNNITQQQMKSFLAGAYLQSGTVKGDTIKFEFREYENPKLEMMVSFINTIEKPKFLNSIQKKEVMTFLDGPTLILLPNKILWDLFNYEEDRQKGLMTGVTLSKK